MLTNNLLTLSLIAVTLSLMFITLHAKPLAIGSIAPDFNLQDELGNWRTLSEFKGKKVVLYFYPKDDTPGCTKEACSFRDSASEYAKHSIIIIGINYDDTASHKAFKEKYHLPFILLSDSTRTVAKAYRAASVLFGYFVPKRLTYLINEDGTILKVFKKVDVASHAEDILEAFGIKK
jgi:peroxiredoxin Q/BCP